MHTCPHTTHSPWEERGLFLSEQSDHKCKGLFPLGGLLKTTSTPNPRAPACSRGGLRVGQKLCSSLRWHLTNILHESADNRSSQIMLINAVFVWECAHRRKLSSPTHSPSFQAEDVLPVNFKRCPTKHEADSSPKYSNCTVNFVSATCLSSPGFFLLYFHTPSMHFHWLNFKFS